MTDPTISIIIPMYNEAEGILAFAVSLMKELQTMDGERVELIWVNDGSADDTQMRVAEICSRDSKHVHKTIEFSKNYGHEAAMLAGIDHAAGGVLICMDSDGQHPPAVIPKMIAAHREGADIVLTQREDRADGSFLMKFLSGLFYSILNKLSTVEFNKNSSDFFLISKKVYPILREEFRERNRFIRGLIQSIGFTKRTVTFEAPKRMHGESSYSFFGLIKLSFNAIFSFSDKPLRMAISFSMLFILFTTIFGCYSLYVFFFENTPPTGYTTIVLFLAISFSVLFVTITVLSLYFEKALKEIRKRPIYIVKNMSVSEPSSTDNSEDLIA